MDLKRLARERGFSYSEFSDLVDIFIDVTKKDISLLERAIRENDMAAAGDAAHSLKGSAGNMGFPELAKAAKSAETYAKEGKSELVKQATMVIKEMFGSIVSTCRDMEST